LAYEDDKKILLKSRFSYYAQRGNVYGHQQLSDAIIKDGLWDAYNNIHMVSDEKRIKKVWMIHTLSLFLG
jgi:ADP-dependent phosphofructokinase/glucokinase